MIFKKRLNNNVVLAVDEHNEEQIVTGKGLGFQMEPGAKIDDAKIEKIFTLKDTSASQRLQELFKTIPLEHIVLAEEIIAYAKMHISQEINENVIISLCDHIYMAVERKKQDIEVKNIMLWDIQKFYRDEYKVGEYAITLIYEKFHVQLNDDEAGFIALHLVNAQMDVKTKSVKEITKVMQDIEKIVRIRFSINIDIDSVYYYRFITHLKFFAERIFSGKMYEGGDVESMLSLVRTKYPKECDCVERIGEYLKEKYEYVLSDEEILYLSIHISRIVQVSK